jgi:50S ribosomal protein L16 3-hydroxylase
MSALQTILCKTPLADFIANYYQRLPFSGAATTETLLDLGSWESLMELLSQPEADVVVCRRNQRLEEQTPRSEPDARRLVEEGYTLLVRHAERLDARFKKLASEVERDMAAPVDVHLYCTPGGEYGFGWHYDVEEVFIVQTGGRKEYSLRKNTVNPWPVRETLPSDMRYDREIMPLYRCQLAAGDWLYIPSGYWHRGDAQELAISLAIGVMPRTGLDVYDFLRTELVESMLWRQRLPILGAASASEEEVARLFQEICSQFGADLAKKLADPRLKDRLMASLFNGLG